MARKHCPVCNGILQWKGRRYTGQAFYCPQCGYQGAFCIEWEDEEKMGTFSNPVQKKDLPYNGDENQSGNHEILIGILLGITFSLIFILLAYYL